MRLAGLVLAALTLAGCACPWASSEAGADSSARAAPLLHLVLFHLEEPADAPALAADCARLLTTIPTVVSYAAGTHVDIGRDTVVSDYDLALRVGFDDVEGYRVYLEHPAHLELLALWKGRLASYEIYDLGH